MHAHVHTNMYTIATYCMHTHACTHARPHSHTQTHSNTPHTHTHTHTKKTKKNTNTLKHTTPIQMDYRCT